MPKNTTILLIRHAEKPQEGIKLSVKGRQRAQAYTVYFRNYIPPGNDRPLKMNHLFATADALHSRRPRLTLKPLSGTLRLPVNHRHACAGYRKMARTILQKRKYNNSHILICWHHEEILALADALGVRPNALPKQAAWPARWPGHVFGWVLQICYDSNGHIAPSHTFCFNQELMADDKDQNPPGVASDSK